MRQIRPALSHFAISVLLLSTIVLPGQAQDALRLPSVFGDHMVLQRDQPIRVWGWSAPGDTIRVEFAAESAQDVADADGLWRVELAPVQAGGPHTLVVRGSEERQFQDVLVGDVWLAGGQSNMEWPLSATNGAEGAIASANHPQIRLFTVERAFAGEPQRDVVSSGWHLTTPESVRDFSAVAYYFGRQLHEELNIPIGLLESNWGGSAAETWMSPDGLARHADYRSLADSMAQGALSPQQIYDREMEAYRGRLDSWSEAVRTLDPGYTVEGAVWAHPSFRPADWDTMLVPTAWEDAGLANYNGIVWFRRTFQLPQEWTGEALTLSLGHVDDTDSTWVNGHRLGGSSGMRGRVYTIPPSVLRSGENIITIRVTDVWGPGGLRGPETDLQLSLESDSRATLSLAGPWLYRPVLRMNELPQPPSPPAQNQVAAGLYNAMIAPVTSFAVKGTIWYQGETNAGRAYQYRTLFPALIEDWRERFGQPEMPFLYVQLANFMTPQQDPNEESAWAELREAQTMTLQLPNTAMAVAIDVGEADDIHPRDKQSVGHRLAIAALGTVYDRDVVFSGPQYVGMRVDGGSIRLLFAHTGSGLQARGGELRGFAIAGPDGRFRWAEARIDGNSVIVRHPEISDPRAVRYGWADNPSPNLYNREGLPAIPFRTDDLPGVTQN